MATDRELAHRQEPKYTSAAAFPYQQIMEMSRSSVDSDSSAPHMVHDDEDSDMSIEDVYAQYHVSGDDAWDTFWYPSDDDWEMKGNNSEDYSAVIATSHPSEFNPSPVTHQAQSQYRHMPEVVKAPSPVVSPSRPRTPSRQRTPKQSRPPTYSLFPRALDAPPKPGLPPRSTSLEQATVTPDFTTQVTVPPTPNLPSMDGPFASIGAVMEAPVTRPWYDTSSPSRAAPTPPVTPSSADTTTSKLPTLDSINVPWTPTREKRWAGTYQATATATQRPGLRNRSASTTAYSQSASNGGYDSRQVPSTPMRPRTQGTGASRPTGDLGHSRLHSSASRSNLRPSTSHHRAASSTHYLPTSTPPRPVPARAMTAKDATEAVPPTPPIKSVFDIDSDDEDATAGSKIKRFVLRPFTSKPPSASANSISPHKRSQSDGKKSLSNGKRVEASKEQQRRARGATEGAAGPFLPNALGPDVVIVPMTVAPGGGALVDVTEQKDMEMEKPKLKRKESFAQFLGFR